MMVETKGGLKMREKPGSTATVRFLIPDKGVVLVPKERETPVKETVDGFEGEWLQVYFEGARGYVFSRFLKPLVEPAGHLYLIKISDLSKRASNETNIAEKARLYDILHKRFLNEGGSPYCSPESDLENCAEACGRASELRYCQGMKNQGFSGSLADFQETVIKAVLTADSQALINLGATCMVPAQICFACDGGGSVPYSRKVKIIAKHTKYISSQGIKKLPNGLQFTSKNGYVPKINESTGQPEEPAPFLGVTFVTKDGIHFIENFIGDLVFGESECMVGL